MDIFHTINPKGGLPKLRREHRLNLNNQFQHLQSFKHQLLAHTNEHLLKQMENICIKWT